MSLETKQHLYIVKCPGCKTPIHLSVGKFVGGFNDNGGIVIQCGKCPHIFPCKIKNPKDASGVTKNGRKIDTWIDDMPEHLAGQYGFDPSELDHLQMSIIVGHEEVPPMPWHANEHTFYRHEESNFESEAAKSLYSYKKELESCYKAAFNVYVKSSFNPKKSFVLIQYEHAGQKRRAVFAKSIGNENDLNTNNLYLIDHSHVDLEHQIDGLYTRDQIMVFLERLLNRWRHTAEEVILVVPFIGFHYKNSQEALYDLWNWLVANVDETKTQLVTRKGTFNLYKIAQDNTGISFDILLEHGLVEPFIDKMAAKDADFFQQSHAKYYVGIYENHMEVLSGSFNIHTGKFLENVLFKKYDRKFFTERYLNMIPTYRAKDQEEEITEELKDILVEPENEENVHFIAIGIPHQKNYMTSLANILSFCRMNEENPTFD